MPKAKRERRERTDNWEQIQQWCRFPEQRLYESIRPVTLYGVTPAERAQETGMAQQTLRRTAEAFEAEGMVSVFRPTRAERASHHRSLPVPMRQLIVDLKTERPGFTLREIAKICAIQFGRQPSHNTVKQVLADGPLPTLPTRHSPHYADIPDPEERRLVVIRLHAASDGALRPSLTICRCPARRSTRFSNDGSKKGSVGSMTNTMPIPTVHSSI